MKKIIAVILSVILTLSIFMVSVNAVTYMFDTVDAYANIHFFVNNSKSQNYIFKNLTLKIKWKGFLEHEENIKNIATTNIDCADVESKITWKSDYGHTLNGETILSFKNEKGVDLSNKLPILTMKVNRDPLEAFIDYYVEGKFVGIDGIDYSKKDIIKTYVTLDKTDKIGEPFFFRLHVNNIGETEEPDDQQDTIVWVGETQETESTSATQPPTETVQPTTSSTEPTEPTTQPAVKAKKANKMKVTVKNKTVKTKKLKNAKVTVKAITVKKANGAVKFSKIAGKSSNRLTVNSKTGKITVKKGTKKGTYKIKIKISAKGTKNYKPKSVTKTIKIKVVK